MGVHGSHTCDNGVDTGLDRVVSISRGSKELGDTAGKQTYQSGNVQDIVGGCLSLHAGELHEHGSLGLFTVFGNEPVEDRDDCSVHITERDDCSVQIQNSTLERVVCSGEHDGCEGIDGVNDDVGLHHCAECAKIVVNGPLCDELHDIDDCLVSGVSLVEFIYDGLEVCLEIVEPLCCGLSDEGIVASEVQICKVHTCNDLGHISKGQCEVTCIGLEYDDVRSCDLTIQFGNVDLTDLYKSVRLGTAHNLDDVHQTKAGKVSKGDVSIDLFLNSTSDVEMVHLTGDEVHIVLLLIGECVEDKCLDHVDEGLHALDPELDDLNEIGTQVLEEIGDLPVDVVN